MQTGGILVIKRTSTLGTHEAVTLPPLRRHKTLTALRAPDNQLSLPTLAGHINISARTLQQFGHLSAVRLMG